MRDIKREILKKVFITEDHEKVTARKDIHKKVNVFKYKPEEASSEWLIDHGLNTTGIQAEIFDENGNVIEPNKVIINNSYRVTIEFAAPQDGEALIIGNVLP